MEIKKTLLEAIGYVVEYRAVLFKAIVIPSLILTIPASIDVSEAGQGLAVVYGLFSLAAYVMIAISTHRVILLGKNSIPPWGVYRPSKRLVTFILYSIGLALMLIPIHLLNFVPLVGWLMALVGAAYFTGRFSLVFPAVATDQSVSFKESWAATAQHQWLMLVVVAVFPFLAMIPVGLVGMLPYSQVLLVVVLRIIATVFIVAALSVAYRVINEQSTRS